MSGMRNPARAIERADKLLARGLDLSRAGRLARSEAHLRKAVRLYQRVSDRDVDAVVRQELRARYDGGSGMRWSLGLALWRLAGVLAARGALGEAVTRCAEAAGLLRTQFELRDSLLFDRAPASMRSTLAACLTDLSLFLSASTGADASDAVRAAAEAVDLLVDVDGSERELATAYHALALARLEDDQPRRADVAIRRALALREPAAEAAPDASTAGYELASSLLLRVRILLATDGDRATAKAALDSAGALVDVLGPAGLPLSGELVRLRERLDA